MFQLILNMFFAPYGCFWAKHTFSKSSIVHYRIPGLVHPHPSIYGGKLFIYFLERADFFTLNIQLFLGGVVSLIFFHPEAGKPVSSFYTSPQASGKGRILLCFSVQPYYPTTSQFQCFIHFYACGDTKTIRSIGSCEKTAVSFLVDMYLTSATQSQLDNICNEAHQLDSHTLHISQPIVHLQLIGHPHYDGLSSKVVNSAVPIFQGQRGAE